MRWIKGDKNVIENLILAVKNYNGDLDKNEMVVDYFCSAFGVDCQLPNIVNRKEYSKGDGIKLYRAYNAKIKDFVFYRDELIHGKFQRYYPRNVLGHGLCFADEKRYALSHSDLKGKLFGLNLVKCKLDSSAKLVNRERLYFEFLKREQELLTKVQDFLQCENGQARKLLQIAKEYDNTFLRGILCGYDGILAGTSDGEKVYVIYNRSCLQMKAKLLERNVDKQEENLEEKI